MALTSISAKTGSLQFPANQKRILWMIFVFSLILRLPAVFQELPPYQFCDEEMFAHEATRLYQRGSFRIQEFRSGSMNVLPSLLVTPVLDIFLGRGLNSTDIIIANRIMLSVLLNAATVFFIAGVTLRLFFSTRAAMIAALIYALSPMVYAVSRYWYPDHYIAFFIAGFLYHLVGILRGGLKPSSYLLTGLFWGLAISVKYTGLLLVIPLAFVALDKWYHISRSVSVVTGLRRLIPPFLTLGIVALLSVAILNFNAFLSPEKFVADWQYNVKNYSRTPGGFNVDGIVFYGILTYAISFGWSGILTVIPGTVTAFRRGWGVFGITCIFPFFYITYFGKQDLVINRNVIMLMPFVIPVFGQGVIDLYDYLKEKLRSPWNAGYLVAVIFAFPACQTFFAFAAELKPDSRLAAAEWIQYNLPESATAGHNEYCSGESPAAEHLQQKVIFDPDFEQRLEYYVINSYWFGSVHAFYRQKPFWQEFRLKDLHYYHFNDPVLWKPEKGEKLESFVPENYRLIQRFADNGPEILIFQRREEN